MGGAEEEGEEGETKGNLIFKWRLFTFIFIYSLERRHSF
jgi:hypothetical protein